MAKYNSIIKRMDYVHQVKIINGSRKMLKALLIYVERTFRETEIFHEKLMALISEDSIDYDDTQIENLRIKIDICFSELEEYLESRLINPTSDTSSTRYENKLGDDEGNEEGTKIHLEVVSEDLIDLESVSEGTCIANTTEHVNQTCARFQINDAAETTRFKIQATYQKR